MNLSLSLKYLNKFGMTIFPLYIIQEYVDNEKFLYIDTALAIDPVVR